MKRSSGHSHTLNDLFKESRNPIKGAANTMAEVMKSKCATFSETSLTSEFNLSL
ncbi:MAG TPA: hypothetical protein PKK26_14770 [Candidatus Wallbacteria bacterium]|nr:hypothetical protein [Candidatus Wallbacteria bacterium]